MSNSTRGTEINSCTGPLMPWSEFRKTNIWAESHSRAFNFYFIWSLFIYLFLSAQALTGKAKRAKTSDFGCDVFRSAAVKTHNARGCSTQPCAHALKLCSPTAPVSTALAKPQSATSKKVWNHRLCHNVLTGWNDSVKHLFGAFSDNAKYVRMFYELINSGLQIVCNINMHEIFI